MKTLKTLLLTAIIAVLAIPSALSVEAPIDDAVPGGTGTVKEDVSEGKEFFTIETKDGKMFYLVIDRKRGGEDVYFLDTVTLSDLRSLADGAVIGEAAPAPVPSTEPVSPMPEPPKKDNTFTFVIIAVIGIGAVGFYFKILKPKRTVKQRTSVDHNENSDYFNEEDDTL